MDSRFDVEDGLLWGGGDRDQEGGRWLKGGGGVQAERSDEQTERQRYRSQLRRARSSGTMP